MLARINGDRRCLRQAVDREGAALETIATKQRDRKATRNSQEQSMKRCGDPAVIVTVKLRSYGVAMKFIGNVP